VTFEGHDSRNGEIDGLPHGRPRLTVRTLLPVLFPLFFFSPFSGVSARIRGGPSFSLFLDSLTRGVKVARQGRDHVAAGAFSLLFFP